MGCSYMRCAAAKAPTNVFAPNPSFVGCFYNGSHPFQVRQDLVDQYRLRCSEFAFNKWQNTRSQITFA